MARASGLHPQFRGLDEGACMVAGLIVDTNAVGVEEQGQQQGLGPSAGAFPDAWALSVSMYSCDCKVSSHVHAWLGRLVKGVRLETCKYTAGVTR